MGKLYHIWSHLSIEHRVMGERSVMLYGKIVPHLKSFVHRTQSYGWKKCYVIWENCTTFEVICPSNTELWVKEVLCYIGKLYHIWSHLSIEHRVMGERSVMLYWKVVPHLKSFVHRTQSYGSKKCYVIWENCTTFEVICPSNTELWVKEVLCYMGKLYHIWSHLPIEHRVMGERSVMLYGKIVPHLKSFVHRTQSYGWKKCYVIWESCTTFEVICPSNTELWVKEVLCYMGKLYHIWSHLSIEHRVMGQRSMLYGKIVPHLKSFVHRTQSYGWKKCYVTWENCTTFEVICPSNTELWVKEVSCYMGKLYHIWSHLSIEHRVMGQGSIMLHKKMGWGAFFFPTTRLLQYKCLEVFQTLNSHNSCIYWYINLKFAEILQNWGYLTCVKILLEEPLI